MATKKVAMPTGFDKILEEADEKLKEIARPGRRESIGGLSVAMSQSGRPKRRDGSGSVYIPDMNLPMYRNQHLDGSHIVPKSPRRIIVANPDLPSMASVDKSANMKSQALPIPQLFVNDVSEEDEEIVIDPTHVDPYLQALSVTKFQVKIFLFELFTHVFMPIAVLLFVFTPSGRTYLYNRSFIGIQVAFFVQYLILASMILIHVVYILYPPKNIPFYEILLLDVLFVIRNAVIATKYAFVSPLEHSEMLKVRETPQIRSDRQVISGWAQPSKNSVDTQILLASVRQQVDLTMAFFDVYEDKDVQEPRALKQQANIKHNQAAAELQARYAEVDAAHNVVPLRQPATTAVLDGEDEKKAPVIAETEPTAFKKENVRISAWEIANSFIKSTHDIQYNGRIVLFFTLLHCFSPIFWRAVDGVPVTGEYTWSAILITVLSVFCSFFLMLTNFAFLLIALMDISRRKALMLRLNAFLSDGYVFDPRTETSVDDEPIRLNMNKPCNITSWWYLKLVLQDYGLQYYMRINAYSGYRVLKQSDAFKLRLFAAFSVTLVIILAVQAIFNYEVSKNVIFLVIMNINFVLFALTFVISTGGTINHVRKTHARTVINRRFDIESIIMKHKERVEAKKPAKPIPDYINQTKELLEIMLQAIRTDNELLVVKVLGFTASSDLMQFVGAIIITGLVSAIKLLFKLNI